MISNGYNGNLKCTEVIPEWSPHHRRLIYNNQIMGNALYSLKRSPHAHLIEHRLVYQPMNRAAVIAALERLVVSEPLAKHTGGSILQVEDLVEACVVEDVAYVWIEGRQM